MKKLFFVLLFLFTASLCFAYDRPLVNNINAVPGSGTKINLMWNLPENLKTPLKKILVYINTKPISSYEQIKNSSPAATLKPTATAWSHKVEDLNDWYYAVVCVTDKPYDIIMPSINATVRGVHLTGKKISADQVITREEKVYPSGTLRETPLPYLDLLDNNKTENVISKATTTEARKLGVAVVKKTERLNPYVFEEDLVSPDGGDAYLLFDILSRTFIQKKYVEGIEELKRLIGTNVTEDVLARATFYLGECEYFATDYESAVRSFVRIQPYFPDLCTRWITSSLDNITISK